MKIKRFKGLGEMNARELFDTTMDKNRRCLVQITMEDALAADKTFSVLMSDAVEQRREWLMRRARFAKDLDV